MFDLKLNCYITKEEAAYLIETSKVNISFQGDEFVAVYSPQENGKDWTVFQWQTCDLQLTHSATFVHLDGAKAHINRQIKSWLLDELNRQN